MPLNDDISVDRPFNSWNRMPYWTLNGVDDGFGSWPNVSKPAPGASAVKDFDRIRRNFVFTVSSVSMSVHLRIVRVFGQAVVLLRSTLAQVKERVRVPEEIR